MKFYWLRIGSNRKIFGPAYPQTEIVRMGDFKLDLDVRHEKPRLGQDGPIRKLDEVPALAFRKSAKVTDALMNVYLSEEYFLLITDRLLRVLVESRLPEFETFTIPVHRGDEVLSYHLFHLAYPSNGLVDFARSEFYIGKMWQPASGPIVKAPDLASHVQMEKEVRESHPGEELLCKRMVIDLSSCEYDLFRLTVVPPLGYFISERLKQRIEALGYTGFDFKEIDTMKHDRVVAVY
jgi:hypothetical protein